MDTSLDTLKTLLAAARAEISKVIIGQADGDRTNSLISHLSPASTALIDRRAPGLAKTLLVRSIAQVFGTSPSTGSSSRPT